MLTVTDAACAFLAELLTEADAPEGVAIRFIIEEQGLAMRLDNHHDGDDSFNHGERLVLLVDEEMSVILDEKTLDVEESDEGPKLALR